MSGIDARLGATGLLRYVDLPKYARLEIGPRDMCRVDEEPRHGGHPGAVARLPQAMR
jgi:hypothetical protein